MSSQPDDLIQVLRLAAIVESSDDAIVSKDVDGIITSWNAAAERMFGWTAAEAVGRSIRLIIPQDRQSEEDMVLSRIRRGEPVHHFETVRLRRTGELFDVSISVSPIRTPVGRVVGASKIARDISERKRIERALLDARAQQSDLQRRLTTIINASGALLTSPRTADVLPAIVELARQVVPADAAAVWTMEEGAWRAAASHGLSETFLATPVPATVSLDMPDDIPVALESLDDPRAAPRRAAYEREGIRAVLAVPLRPAPELRASIGLYYRHERPFGLVERESASGLGRLASAAITTSFLYEAQRRRRIESEFVADVGESLARSRDHRDSLERLAHRAVPALADWCVVHLQDDEGRLVMAASAGAAQGQEGVWERVLRGAPGDASDTFSIERVMRTGAPGLVEWTGTGEPAAYAGERRDAFALIGPMSLVSVPLVAHSRLIGTLTLARLSAEVRWTPPDVGFVQDVAYRVALAVDNVRAYEEARSANRLKDEFLATLSHELRTPLNAIVGYAQMLKKGAMPPERQQRAYEVLEKNARALTQIVEDVLDISRIVTGKIRLALQPVALDGIVRQSVETVQPGADAKGVTVQLTNEASSDMVAGDPDRLQQVFWNLLSNAVKFTPKDGRIDVGITCADGLCTVTVADNGSGIDPQFLPFIFERFRQADARHAREHGGLGLGLAIARQIVELHGGSIEARSAGKGQGAVFRVALPALTR
ncbi:MAG: PAS domain S-box protein [Vicinamibacterales bacterium]